jgi:hypothetical protein
MSLLWPSRSSHRRPRLFNSGFAYGGFSALLFVIAKTLKYSGGGGKADLPWAILIIVAGGLVGGLIWHLARIVLNAGTRRDRNGDKPGSETGDPNGS